MKKHQFTLTLEFEDKICSDSEIKEIMENVIRAIQNECDSGMGIAPENSETFTRVIGISSDVINEEKVVRVMKNL